MKMRLLSDTLVSISLETNPDQVGDKKEENLRFEIGYKSRRSEEGGKLEFAMLTRMSSESGRVSCAVEYRGVFALDAPLPSNYAADEELQKEIGEIGIAQLYPYVRELIYDIMRRTTVLFPLSLPPTIESIFDSPGKSPSAPEQKTTSPKKRIRRKT